jgi:hypothetical protein
MLTKPPYLVKPLRFLNPAYWLDSDTPPNIAVGITQQLKEHRDSLGVSGRPPQQPFQFGEYSYFRVEQSKRCSS